ncbi:hypothetical protein B0H17DRAFT_1182053 [Mycena rosella]|uniref:Uncharacterized protein n=1 Tax=Mycena rosella TaxID=1033263 RepID=A0AAD7D6V1_MYCRO|nr:hypothetical protein B0H17DRAFT_1182053 [Mycena rosella]
MSFQANLGASCAAGLRSILTFSIGGMGGRGGDGGGNGGPGGNGEGARVNIMIENLFCPQNGPPLLEILTRPVLRDASFSSSSGPLDLSEGDFFKHQDVFKCLKDTPSHESIPRETIHRDDADPQTLPPPGSPKAPTEADPTNDGTGPSPPARGHKRKAGCCSRFIHLLEIGLFLCLHSE